MFNLTEYNEHENILNIVKTKTMVSVFVVRLYRFYEVFCLAKQRSLAKRQDCILK